MWADNVTDKDFLGFDVHADLIKELIEDDSMLPITIGLFGDWGSGKSSILEVLKLKLDSPKEGIACLFFNGWVFEGYDDAKAALIESIVEEFKNSEKFGDKLEDNIKKLVKSINWMRVIGFGMKKIVIPATTAYLTGGLSLIAEGLKAEANNSKDLLSKLQNEDVESFLKQFLKESPNAEEPISSIREFRENFKQLIQKSKIKKLIIIIDDLDRCSPERIIDNLEAIKLFLNVENTAFIIGADPRIVRHAIEYRYKSQLINGNDENRNERIVNDYLEKLIQIPYNLPKLSDSEVETYITLLFCERDLDKESFANVLKCFKEFKLKDRYSVFSFSNIQKALSEDQIQKLSSSVSLIAKLSPIITESLYGNPRQIKRFLNTFMLRKKLAKVANIGDFKDDVLAKLMILEYAEPKLFEALFDWQTSQKGKPNELSEIESICENAENIKIALAEKYKDWSHNKIVNWVKVLPKLSEVDLRDYFWLSRDKLTSIKSNFLTPPFIKSLLLKLSENLPGKLTKEIIKTELAPLGVSERIIFYTLLNQQIILDPTNKRLYDIFNYSLEEDIEDGLSLYLSVLKTIGKKVPPAVFESLKRFEKYPDIITLCENHKTTKKKS